MLANVRVAKSLVIVCSILFLCHCTKAITDIPQPKKAAQVTPFTMPATAYLALATNQPEGERQSMQIMAAGRYLYENQWQEALRILTQTSTVSLAQADQKNVLLAKIDTLRDQPRAAINTLSSVKEPDKLPLYYQGQYHELLASAYEAAGNATYAIAERIKADPLLMDEAGRDNNRRNLWLTLAKLPVPELNTLSSEAADDSPMQAWLQLALIPRESTPDSQTLYNKVLSWQRRYPEHPANSLLPQPLTQVKPWLQGTPRQIALLLPVTGPLSGPGLAIRDGFMAAYNNQNVATDNKVRVYDTAATDVSTLYEQALADGAQYVVGPLTKSDAAKIAVLPHPVPTLLLNDVDRSVADNAWQFGLSPANEARQVAAKARKNGFSNALVIAPSGAWGDEIVAAFSTQWQQGGGRIIDRMAYDRNSDLSLAVRTSLHVSEQDARAKQVKPVAGAAPIVSKRRQDFDVIFLVAYPSHARQIMPLLKYYFAGDVPVYATSSVYTGNTNTMRDRDLNGIVFCDMPWVFEHQLANKNWPEQFNSYNRLYAMGMDSFALATQMNQLMLFPALGVSDQSGILYLNKEQQIARVPVWGKFKNGVAVVA